MSSFAEYREMRDREKAADPIWNKVFITKVFFSPVSYLCHIKGVYNKRHSQMSQDIMRIIHATYVDIGIIDLC